MLSQVGPSGCHFTRRGSGLGVDAEGTRQARYSGRGAHAILHISTAGFLGFVQEFDSSSAENLISFWQCVAHYQDGGSVLSAFISLDEVDCHRSESEEVSSVYASLPVKVPWSYVYGHDVHWLCGYEDQQQCSDKKMLGPEYQDTVSAEAAWWMFQEKTGGESWKGWKDWP